MATVTKNSPPPTPPPTYTIELSEDEAAELYALLGKCTSDLDWNDLLYVKLGELGFTYDEKRNGRIGDHGLGDALRVNL